MMTASTLASGLAFTSPDRWMASGPASSMRVAQFTLPRAASDTQDAELVLYYFGGGGGSVEANIERWLAQIQQPDGRQSTAVARRDQRTINGLPVTLVDVSGTYVAEVSPGASARHNSPNFRLRAGVVTTAKGPYFIKLTGPATTVAAHEKDFEQFLSSLKYQP